MDTIGPELLAWVLDHHGPTLELYARQWSASPADIVQDTLVELAGQSVVPTNLVAWLYRVARHRAIDAARRAERRHRHETAAADQAAMWFVADVDSKLDAAAVQQCLTRLPLEAREIVILHLWSGLSFEEIAALVGVSSSTAHRHYHEALQSLRQMLEQSCHTKTNPPRS